MIDVGWLSFPDLPAGCARHELLGLVVLIIICVLLALGETGRRRKGPDGRR